MGNRVISNSKKIKEIEINTYEMECTCDKCGTVQVVSNAQSYLQIPVGWNAHYDSLGVRWILCSECYAKAQARYKSPIYHAMQKTLIAIRDEFPGYIPDGEDQPMCEIPYDYDESIDLIMKISEYIREFQEIDFSEKETA